MHPSRRSLLPLAAGALLALAACGKPAPAPPARPASPPGGGAPQEAVREQGLPEAAAEAYVYGYPLVSMELARRVATNVAKPVAGRQAPMGQLIKQRALPSAGSEPAAAGADLLAVQAWLDVGAEPWIITVPDVKGRYLVLALLSGWTEVFEAPGSRTSGTRAQRLAVTGPGWSGKLPAGVIELKSPTALVWMAGGIATTGTRADLAEVHALQDRITLVPLSASGTRHAPPVGRPDPAVDMKATVREQVHALDGVAYFKLLGSLLKANPPAPEDGPALAALARFGLVPGQDFDGAKLDAVALKALAGAPRGAQERIMAQAARRGSAVNGWSVRSAGVGSYGTDWLQRAATAAAGLGANRPQDEVVLVGESDAEGRPLEGARRYQLHFAKGQLPPAKGPWSLALRDGRGAPVPNRLNRHALGSRARFRLNKDGSLDLLVQKDPPVKGREANWLPAPAGRFVLTMRLHWPLEKPPSILDGSWKPPAITPAK
jgi:hypothetical protein